MTESKDPRRMWSSKENAVNKTEAGMLLDACLSPLDYLVVCLALHSGFRVVPIQTFHHGYGSFMGLITEDSNLHLHINTEPASAAGREGDDPGASYVMLATSGLTA